MSVPSQSAVALHLSQTSLPFGADPPPPDLFGPVLLDGPEEGHPIGASLVFSFHEPFILSAGSLTIVANGVRVDYELLNNPAISVVGNTLVFKPPQALLPSTIYMVFITAGAIRDASGNAAHAGQVIGAAFMSGPDTAPVKATGTDGPDKLYGGEQADVLSGMGDADRLVGFSGNDLLDGGAGNDELLGGPGDDVLNGGSGNDNLSDGEGNNILRGGDGDDTLGSPGPGTGLLDGGAGNDFLVGNDNTDYIGGDGDDTLHVSIWAAQTRTVLDGGAGADRFELLLQDRAGGQFAVTGGSGVDTYAFWGRENTLASNAQALVSDFAPGTGGDRLDLSALIPARFTGDPFAGGFLRLVADGNDTLVQVNRSDVDASSGYLSLLRLANVRPGQLTAANFVGGYDPAVAGRGAQLVGTPESDFLRGSPFDDTLLGLGDSDTLYGGAGNDRLDGGEGDDFLYGEAGDDVLLGGNGDDTLEDAGSPTGSNQLFGGAGNDKLTVHSRGTNLVDGGEGNDRLEGGSGDDTLVGGDGDDVLLVRSTLGAAPTTISLSGGAGDDRLQFSLLPGNAALRARGGTGADTFVLDSPMATLAIEDFSAAEGDVLDLQSLLPAGLTSNPFGPTAYLRLTQSGSDTLVFADLDGAKGGGAPVLAVRLAGVALASLTGASIAGGHALDGSSAGLRLDGTAGPDALAGDKLDDTLRGFGGADRLFGGAGNDTLDGGADDDDLNGGEGDDVLLGGDGDDVLADLAGLNILDGGAGADTIRSRNAARSEVLGGAGNDYIETDDLVASVDGGSGDDRIFVDFSHSESSDALRIAGGDGTDRITLSGFSVAARPVLISGGAGRDSYEFGRQVYTLLTIQDFQAGANGDLLDIFALLPGNAKLGGSNPLGPSGWLRLVQRGPDTVLQRDDDGAAGPAAWTDAVVFSNTQLAAFSGANFSEGADPHGSSSGMERNGTPQADVLQGASFGDTLRGGGGDDKIYGLDGDDLLYGDEGDDTLVGGKGNDRLDGGVGNDQLEDDSGANTLHGGDGNDHLVSLSRDGGLLAGDAGNDRIEGRAGQVLDGGAGNDAIDALDLAGAVTRIVTVHGGDGDDNVRVMPAAAAGFTVVADGGAGRDIYSFVNQPAGAILKILDFATGEGGDLLDLRGLVGIGVNPFIVQHGVQLVQRGPDAVLQTRGGALGVVDVVVFANTQATAIVAANIFGGYPPNGSTAGLSIVGTSAAEHLVGGPLDDVIRGEGGDDRLEGGAGNDQLFGGDGDDELWDGAGIDKLYGGDGNDQLTGAIGSWQWSSPVSDLPYLLLDGGAGNDFLYGANLYNFMGGSGDDKLHVVINGNAPVRTSMDGGDGADLLDFRIEFRAQGQLAVSGGAGIDTFRISGVDLRQAMLASIRVTDFTPGPGGDQIALQNLMPFEQDGNPFASGLFRLIESSGNTLFQVRQSGSQTDYLTLLELAGVRPSELTSANFSEGVDPLGGSAGFTLSGTGLDDVLVGGPSADVLFGQAGNDVLVGHGGNDRLDGGSGDDELDGGAGNDILLGGDGNDELTDFGGGSNELYGGAGNDYLEARSPDSNLLDGGPGDDQLLGQNANYLPLAGQYTLRGGAGNDYLFAYLGAVLEGGDGNDVLVSGNGGVRLDGGNGNDVLQAHDAAGDILIGGAGIDRARFSKSSADYTVTANQSGLTVLAKSTGTVDTLTGIERLQFSDRHIALDIDGAAGQTYRIYRAAFDRAPDLGGMGFWLSQMDKGVSLTAIAAGFIASKEFADLYGSAPTNAELVTRMYTNVLHRAPNPGGYAFWLDVLDTKKADLATVLASISESAENQMAVAELIANGIAFAPYTG